MPVTRTRSQTRIDFPARKTSRTSKQKSTKLTLTDENCIATEASLSCRKRLLREDVSPLPGCSPAKKMKAFDKENPQIPHISTSPVKGLMAKRIPLTPRKDPNILAPLHYLSPSKKHLHLLRSPGKENCMTPGGTTSPRQVRALNFGSPINQQNCVTPLPIGITKGRALTFDSPPKNVIKSPRKSVGTPRPCVKPVVSPMRLLKQEGLCYQRAKKALNTAMPQRLLCREDELAIVDTFLHKHLGCKVPGSLYISGAPGTGKTAVMTRTMDKLRTERRKLVYVNCMSLRNSQAIYNKILGELCGKECSFSSKQAQSELEKQMSSKGEMVVLVLDEMDQLDSKNQEILYTMFEWPSLVKSRLVLIGIANALDLTDRILPRLQARPKCKPELLNFPPYSRDQIVTVLQERLKQVEVDGQTVLEQSALRFCACKVAAVAGDMRKALDVCRRAVEMVESDVRKQQILAANGTRSPSKRPPVPKKIGVPHILKIINEVYGSRMPAHSGEKQTVPLQQKLAICSLLLQLRNGKSKEVLVGKLHETYRKVCQKQNVAAVDQSEFLSVCTLIEARGIVGLKKAKDARSTKVSLKLDERELEAALQDKTLISSVLKNGL